MSQNKPYFFQSFAIIVIAIVALIGFRQVLPKKIFTETTNNTKNVVVDSMMLEAVQEKDAPVEKDTLEKNTQIDFEEVNGIKFPAENFDDYKGYQHLVNFYEKLLQLETKKQGNVRIAYFGDSMTDGDMIVKEFRSSLQARFGGEGVGFVNITSESAQSRSTVSHQFSSNWKTLSFLNVKNPKKPFGISGQVFFVKKDTVDPVWVKYKASNFANIKTLNNPTLFYGKSGNKQAVVDFIVGKDTIHKKLNPVNKVNTLSIGLGDIKSFKAQFTASDSIPFYGFNFDDGRGVHVDNFSNRGNSGLPISTFDTSVMRAFNDKLGYDLIVLQYGTNVLNYGSLNYTWYERKMAKVIAHLRECFPGVAILIISSADKSTKYDLEMKTDSAVVPLTRAQRKYAVSSGSAYVNLYTLMGGDGSMVKWVEEVPAMANKDYTHFNYRGAKKISDLIYKQLNNGYEQYKKLRGHKNIEPEIIEPEIKKQDSIIQKTDTTHAQ
ncbi:SGNH/GDSL hydrolase family protein [Flavobacterium sp. NRK1]|uniref:SGNH/GDSL hydrolase family protein n=1 Tax=Flavobacterium sp. NRK1 TaxID=2954929 RepID=UPI0020920B9B|nr:SGNH/GDSL hydrolase family protein [Flavobacterium sp. NRK1]MCO6146826.1 SGNH/GDSL hydrolase family protein [Flavobacterium sp. NRK1]